MDFVVEKATELGVASILPFTSSFTVPKLDDKKIAKRTERWRKIALSAAKQCGRTQVPEILPLCEFRCIWSRAPAQASSSCYFGKRRRRDRCAKFTRRNATADRDSRRRRSRRRFKRAEAQLAAARDFHSVHLGRRILRAETAAVTALSLVQFLWGDLT